MRTDKIEDIYPLSPMQAGIVFHTLYAAEHAVYLDQQVYAVEGNLDTSVFERAWNCLLERHAVLRTSFHWEGLDEPLQVVHAQADLSLESRDWSRLSAREQQEALSALLREDRARGLDLTRAPLMRLTLIRTGAETWQFLWTAHHLILDRWSVSQILSDLSVVYESLSLGKRIELPALRPYGDYIGWLQEQDPTAAESYWKRVMAGFTSPTALPMDRGVGRHPGGELPARLRTRLSEEATSALLCLARQHRLTLSTLVQGAWALLLSRYSGEDDVLFGVTVSGRPHALPGVETMVGMFINSLPVRVQLPAATPVIVWLQQLQEAMAEMREYEYSSLVQIQRWSDIPGGVPLFETHVVVQNTPSSHSAKAPGEECEPGAALTFRSVVSETSVDFPLTVTAIPGSRMGLSFHYNAERYDESDIVRMQAHLSALLQEIAADPSRPLCRVPLLTEAERHQVLVEWNATAVSRRERCVHQLFEEQVERTPDAVAVVCEGKQLTYQELNARANQLAHYLVQFGVGPDVPVGICLERSLEMVVGLLGILKAGGAYVPLDPSYPLDRLAFMLEDSEAPVLLSREADADALPSYPLSVLCLDADWWQVAGESEQNLRSSVAADNAAYIIYTSGTTGRPKGAVIRHGGLSNYLAWATEAYAVAQGQGAPVHSSLSFDLTVTSLLPALLVGKTTWMLPEADGVEALSGILRQAEDFSLVKITPAHLELLSRELAEEQVSGRTRAFVIGGEALRADQLAFWQERAPMTRLFNEYGPTETVVGCCVYEAASTGAISSGGIPIGRPIANTQLYLLDRSLLPVPIGAVGELYIGGDGLARGYLNRPDLTAEKFVPHPFSAEPGARLYRTGDRCRYLADGNIEYLGRLDHQVKIRGFRIELGEIESVLSRHPAVQEVTVVAREDVAGDRRLVAYLVAGAEAVRSGDLRAYLKGQLPDYMLPSAFVFLDALPLSPNGKVDSKRLPPPEAQGQEESYVTPRTPIEEGLAEIWCDVLRLERAGVHDSFFELGGHSLLATQVISRIRSTFQIELTLNALFDGPTIAELAQQISAASGAEGASASAPGRIEREEPVPLSFSQQRLWFLDQLEPGSPLYNIPVALHLEGLLDVSALEAGFAEIMRRHEALRTTFALQEGEPCQIVHTPASFALPVVDLTAHSAEAQEREWRRLVREEAQRSFDLSQGPLLRATLLRLGDQAHILLCTLHHIVSDGWSQGILVRELSALYNAFAAGKPSPLPELPIQYADYAVWQRNWLQGETLERQLRYWKAHLAGAPALLELPTDHPRPPMQSFRGAIQRRDLPLELTQRIKALSQQEGATLFMTLLTAFQTLLSRYSGQDQIVVGTPIANRTHAETEGVIGFFLNTLALRGDLSGDPSFRELLGRVREVCLGAYAHQDLPFEKLVDELQPQRTLSHSQIFQVMLTLQNAPRETAGLEGLKIQSVRAEGVNAKYDLLLGISETGNGLRMGLEYSTDLFDPETIMRLLDHFQTLLEGVTANPEQKISCLPLLSDSERRQLLTAWNDTASPFPDRCLHSLVEAQADRTPDAVAVVFEGETLTYRRLDQRANQLAHALLRLGIGQGAYVGVALPRSPQLLVALLGVLKAGAAYVPIDLDYPRDRIAYMIADADVGAILSLADVVALLPPQNAPLLCLDAEASRLSQEPAHRPGVEVDTEAPAYVIYTSGTTGRPKGVVVPHRAILNHMEWMQHTFPLTAQDRVLHKTPLSFDASVWECWAPLMAGAQLIVARPGGQGDPGYLTELVQQHGITTLKVVPSLLQMLLEEARFGACAGLRQVFCGAETLPRELQERFFALFGDRVALHNLYGPTEAAIDATGFTCRRDWNRASVPIGRPIANVTAYLLDRNGQPVPVGVAGELALGGVSLARGYLNRPDLTAEKFVPHPFSAEPGARLYRTGDRCRYLADGNIEYLGRLDHQVKIRGFRIELGEIESVLSRHPAVQEVTVVAREDVAGDRRLVAYLVAGAEAVRSGDLRAYLKGQLPDYMLPSAFVFLDALPLSPSGKLDRSALPPPEMSARDEADAVPGTPIEEGLAEIWREVLRVEAVGVHDSFFELGGHSLLAMQVIARVRKTFDVEIPLRALFETPTVAGLAQHIQHARHAGEGIRIPSLLPVSREGDLPLSFSQQRVWFIDQFQPNSFLYNVPRRLRMRGHLDTAALQQALQEIVARHEVLRTTYRARGGNPVQSIAPDPAFPLPVCDLRELPGDREAEAERLCQEEAVRPFDLANDLMIRGLLLRLGEEEHILALTLHHIASDGWSNSILTRELSRLYNAFTAGKPSPLSKLPIQYADYAVWQRNWLQGEALEQQVTYWRDRLAGAPPVLDLPTDRPREQATSYQGGREPFRLPETAVEGLRRLCREERATQFMVLLAAFNVLLHRWTGQTDLVVGTDIANRTQPETEGLIGFFLNHLVLRTDLSGDPSFREVVDRAREVCLGAYAHQDLPFDKLVEVLQPERSTSHTPVFQVLFVVQNVPRGRTELHGLELERVGSEFPTSKFDLCLFLGESGGGLGGVWVYRTDLFDAGSIAHLSDRFLGLLGELVSRPDVPIEDVELLSKIDSPQGAEVVPENLESRRGARRRMSVVIEATGL